MMNGHGKQINWFKIFNPTPVRGGVYHPPYQKMAITPLNSDPKEPKLCDFSYISMTNPPIPFLGLKMARKGVFIAFLLSAVPISGSRISFFCLF